MLSYISKQSSFPKCLSVKHVHNLKAFLENLKRKKIRCEYFDLQWSLPQQGSITLDRLQDGLSLPRSEFAQIQFDIDTLVFTNCFAYILICPLTKRAKIKRVDISLYTV